MTKSSAPPVGQAVEGLAQRRILVVDDDPAILKVWLKVLGPKGSRLGLEQMEKKLFGADSSVESPGVEFSIDTALQGKEGYQKVVSALEEGRPYTFALVDMRMPPGWDGMETTQHMLETDPRLEVAICSAFSDISREEVAERVGRADLQWLRKPFDIEVAREFARRLNELGAQRRQVR
jgi:CheY-like chemotaxis protein